MTTMKYLFDTNVISELVAKQPNSKVIRWIETLDPDIVYLSVLTTGELSKGIEKLPTSKRKDLLRNWLHDDLLLRFSGHILALDVDVMLAWGRLIAELERASKLLSAIDSLTAAVALHHNCTLVSRNANDFGEIGIVVMNPWKAGA